MRETIKACRSARHGCLSTLVLLAALWPGVSGASSQLALAKGCYSCHGEPPRKNVPSFPQLAVNYAKYQGQTHAARKLAQKLCEGTLFAHIASHERLSTKEAETLIQWVIDGAK